ncbi:site-specific DNA-methyltransferase [Hydrogenophaga taeniospiralis]|uniref:site-specific DNA-methyltransferase n=1 Tax=Hydrogenophaga taeniospiralis TaxID=65656 RepID=UPI001CFB5913|nr:site-specific DNA-methyltransferase [Hydrogenophaga taeniospiralis]UCU95234.1 site-specific DNA-methyltransferase [Hydrogenophaga taeniospiralis]
MIQKIEALSTEAQSADLVADNINKLKALFPELVTETSAGGKTATALNIDVLKALIGDTTATDGDEKYGLNWHGKRKARQIALTPSTGTLRPVPAESVDWDTTQNLMIEGDNLEVLKLLQKSYAGKVKLIYIDPPYNTGKDFVYPDNFQDNIKNYLELTGQTEGGAKISSNTDASGRFHTDWLNMIYPRLKLARSLLRDDGAIFVSIGDQELVRVRSVLDEIFGEENFIANVVWQKKQSPQNDAINLSDMHDHIVIYAKQAKQAKTDLLGWQRNKVPREEEQELRYENKDEDARGDWTSADLTCNKNADERPNLYFSIKNPVTNEDIWPSRTRVWAYEKSAMDELLSDNRVWWGKDGKNMPRRKVFRTEVDDGVVPSTWWTREFAGDNQAARRELRALFPSVDVFDTPKPTLLIKRIIELGTAATGGDIVLDFFCGSASTGQAVIDKNSQDNGSRRFILIQLPEPIATIADEALTTISKIAMERLRRTAKKYQDTEEDFHPDIGFRVFKLDTSNIRAWNPNAADLKGSLFSNLEHVEPGRSNEDVLYEILLKLGLDLCVPMEQKQIAGKTVHSIGGGTLLACLDEHISAADAEALALGMTQWREEQGTATETTAVFRDSAFENDVAKSNLAAILEQHGIKHVRSL